MIYNDYMSRLEFMLSTAKIKFGSANEAYEKICRESEGHNDLVSRTARKSAFRKKDELEKEVRDLEAAIRVFTKFKGVE